MPTVGKLLSGGAALVLAVALRWLTGQTLDPAYGANQTICKFFSQLPDDCAEAENRKYDNLRGHRYEEIDLFAKDALKKVPYVSMYNTTGLNGGEDSKDSAPKSLSDQLDPKAIAKRFQAISVAISPPRYWTVDWIIDRIGVVRNFGGLNAAWMGNSQAPAAELSAKPTSEAYRTRLVASTFIAGFKKGSEVYLLDDPKGRTWVLISYTDKNIPGITVDKLESLGELINLPQGWTFRPATLNKDLILEPKGGFAGFTQDDKGNVYALTGARLSNFVP
jgi:hypothetical protein